MPIKTIQSLYQARSCFDPGTGGGGSSPTTVYGPQTLTDIDGGWQGYTFVQIFDAANMAAASGTQARITITLNALFSGATIVCYFGQQAGSGDVYDFNGNQVHMLFSGTDITGDGSTLVFISDWMTLGETYNETKNYVCAAEFAVAPINLVSVASTGDNNYYKASAAEAATTNKSGYTVNRSNTAELVSKIEVQ